MNPDPKPRLAELSDEAKRVLIAEKCGWTRHTSPNIEFKCVWRKGESYRFSHPDYLGSLDAMAEAEASLTWQQLLEWERRLEQICWYRDGEANDGRTALIRATAAQRADALLLALGLATGAAQEGER